MYDYCNLGHFIWLNPSPSEVPTSGDLKSGDCLFCSTTNIKHRCPHNRKSTQWPQIMTWVWLRTLSEVSHKLQTVKINKIVLAASEAWCTLLVYMSVTPCLTHDSRSRKGTVFVPKHGKKTCKGTD